MADLSVLVGEDAVRIVAELYRGEAECGCPPTDIVGIALPDGYRLKWLRAPGIIVLELPAHATEEDIAASSLALSDLVGMVNAENQRHKTLSGPGDDAGDQTGGHPPRKS